MKSKQFRMLTENGVNYMFNSNAFANYLYKKKSSEKISLESLYGEIADATGYSTDAVKKWKLGCNGVADVETVRILASLLSVDYKKLLTVVKGAEEQNMNTEISYNEEKQTNEITSIYDAMLTYLETFNRTWGFDLEIFPEWEEAQKGRTEYMKEYYKMCGVIYKNASKIDSSIYSKLLRLADELKLLIAPMGTQMEEFPYVSPLWREKNQELDAAATLWERYVEDLEDLSPEEGIGTAEDVFDEYCDKVIREFISQFQLIIE